jgi:uncharacterized membrane protein
MPALFAVINLIAAHIAISSGYFLISALLLSIAFALMVSQMFCNNSICIAVSTCGITGIILSLLLVIDSRSLTYIPPILIHLFLFLFFATPFVTGRTPVITRIAQAIKGPLSDRESNYTIMASAAWAIFMFALLCEAITIALLYPIEIWSIFVNFINYIFVGLMFAGEFMVRKLVLKGEVEPSFLKFLIQLRHIDLHKLASKDG